MTNMFVCLFYSRNFSARRCSLLLLRSVSILFLAKVLGNAWVYATSGQASRNRLNSEPLCRIKLDIKFCWIQWFALRCNAGSCTVTIHSFSSALQTNTRANKRCNGAIQSRLLWANSIKTLQASWIKKLQNNHSFIFHQDL